MRRPTLAAFAGLAGCGAAALLRRTAIRAEHAAAALGAAGVAILCLRAAGISFERARTAKLRDFIRSAQVLAPPGDTIAFVGKPAEPADAHAFGHFYLSRCVEFIPIDGIAEYVAARGGEVLALAHRKGRRAAAAFDHDVVALGGRTWAILRIRARTAGAAATAGGGDRGAHAADRDEDEGEE